MVTKLSGDRALIKNSTWIFEKNFYYYWIITGIKIHTLNQRKH